MAQSKPKYHDVLLLTELQSGLRLCLHCNKLLTLDKFKPHRRDYICIDHQRAKGRHQVLGTAEKRAFNSFRCRARFDMLMFGHKKMQLSRQDLLKIITPQQLENFSQYCVIPRKPDEVLTVDNAVIVGSYQRRYIIGRWKHEHDANQYEQDLAFVLSREAPKK